MGPAGSDALSRGASYSGAGSQTFAVSLLDCHRLWSGFPGPFGLATSLLNAGPTTPKGQAPSVWADPRTLAATDGVAVAFISSGET
jgi:hypothetical protein